MEPMKVSPYLREFNRLSLENDSIYREAARRLGISSCSLWILYTLRADGEPVTQTRLCEILYEPKTTINSCLKQLETQGLIAMVAGSDRRTRHITMTGKGRELAGDTAERLIRAEEAALLDMPPELRDSLLQGLQNYNRNLLGQLNTWNQIALSGKEANSEEDESHENPVV